MFVEDQTFQPILTKPSDFPLEELIETNHFGNMFIEEFVEINHFGNLFTKELVKLHIKGLAINNLIEKITNCTLSNKELVEEGTNILLKNQLVKKVHVSPIPTQINDVSINLIISVNFSKKNYPKSYSVFQYSRFSPSGYNIEK
jgi:hypothetical protein